MGQQQLLLIVLSVIIVGVAIAVGVTQFKSSAVDSNRQAVIGDLVNLAAKAQRYYRTPQQLGGGNQDFANFALSTIEQTNANGNYDVGDAAPGDNSPVVPPTPPTAATGGVGAPVFIIGSGTETGNDGTNPVKVYVQVTPDQITTTILN